MDDGPQKRHGQPHPQPGRFRSALTAVILE
jgi:hypothetical protein